MLNDKIIENNRKEWIEGLRKGQSITEAIESIKLDIEAITKSWEAMNDFSGMNK